VSLLPPHCLEKIVIDFSNPNATLKCARSLTTLPREDGCIAVNPKTLGAPLGCVVMDVAAVTHPAFVFAH